MQSLKTLKNKGSRKYYNAIHVGGKVTFTLSNVLQYYIST